MASAPDPHRAEIPTDPAAGPATAAATGPATGRHLLGAHVVGQRVVVRRVLRGETGPSGGDALTDVLGVCTTWGDGRAVVRTAGGTDVEIAIADIVSGKPVPPRPSVRDRVPAVEAQGYGFALFDDLVTVPLGDWVLRSSETATARRANSVLAMVPAGIDGALAGVVAHYRSLGRRPVAAVLRGSNEERGFLDAGWVPESGDADTLFQVASIAQTRRLLRGLPDLGVTLEVTGDHAVARLGQHASGTAAYSRDWVGLRSIDVAPERRRRGWGLAVVDALLGWGAERGASTAYLQVLGDNGPALGLYERLGFRTHHAYRYLAEA